MVKNLPANAGDVRDAGSVTGKGSSPGGGKGNPLQYSCLGNLTSRGSWQATAHGTGDGESETTEQLSTPHPKRDQESLTNLIRSGSSLLVVQWLRLPTPNAGGLGSIPAQGTRSHMPRLKTLHATTKSQHSQINKSICILKSGELKSSRSTTGTAASRVVPHGIPRTGLRAAPLTLTVL